MARSYTRVEKPPYLTRAVVVVNGYEYNEWTSVQVSLTVNDNPAATFRFTASEQEPVMDEWAAFRIRPPDKAAVFLDGYLAITGFVTTRQAYYAAKQHIVEIQGEGWDGRTGQLPAQSQTGEFKNQTVEQIARALAGQVGVNVDTEGALPNTKIPRFQVQPGETTYEAVEKLMRSIGGHLTSREDGTWTLVGFGFGGGGDEAIEGYNIIEGRETIHTLMNTQNQQMVGQSPGNDQQSGADVTQQHAENQSSSGGLDGLLQQGSQARSLMEIPGFSQELMKQRAAHESSIGDQNMIHVWVHLLGWQKPSGGLWRPLDSVYVDSPMLIMKRSLILKRVTFMQDNDGGTRSQLELVNSAALGGYTPMGGGGQQ